MGKDAHGSLSRKRKQEDDETKEKRRSHEGSKKKEKRDKSPPKSADGVPEERGGGDAMSMSVEETNRVRASLGLAPLETSETIAAENAEKEFNEAGEKLVKDLDTGHEFVHKPADSWTTKNQQEKLREKLEAAKNKRHALAKLSAVTHLGVADEDGDDAASWVQQMRRKEDEKRMAVERAKMLDTMDEEMSTTSAAAAR